MTSLRLLLNDLNAVAEFCTWQLKFSRLPGFLPDLQAYTLLHLAQHGPGSGEIVEIGSFAGRSSVFLGTGSKLAGREKVTAIDHFKGSKEHQDIPGLENLFQAFQDNVKAAGLTDYIEPRVGASEDVVVGWNKPIRLLFIDGAHEYEPAKRDFDLWSPFVVPSGIICIHDIDCPIFPGDDSVTRVYRELMANTDQWTEVASVDSSPMNWGHMKVIQRLR